MDQPSSLLDYIPEEVRPMMAAVQQQRAQRAAQQQQALEAQRAMLQEQKILQDAKFSDLEKQHQEDLKYPATQWDFNREKALSSIDLARKAKMLDLFGQDPKVAQMEMDSFEKGVKERYSDSLRSFSSSEPAKQIDANWNALREDAKRVSLVKEYLNTAQDLLKQGRLNEANDHMKTNLIKPLNSILSNDAIQLSEMVIRYSQLLSAKDINMLKGSRVFDSSAYLSKWLDNKNKNPEAQIDQEALVNDLAGMPTTSRKTFLNDFFSKTNADPVGFAKIAANGVNSAIKSFNSRVDAQVVSPSSPGYANSIGAHYIKPIYDPSAVRVKQK